MSTIDKAMAVLSAFTIDTPELGVTEISRALDLNKVVVHRLLRELEANGMIEQDPDSKRYRLGYEVLKLATRKLSSANLLRTAIPHLDALREETGESVHLSIKRGEAILRLYIVQTRHFLRYSADVGDESPIHCTAAGKILLAYSDPDTWRELIARSIARFGERVPTDIDALCDELESLRSGKVAVDDEVFQSHLRAFACPVFDSHGRVTAAVSCGGISERVPRKRFPAMIAAIENSCATISRELGLCKPD